MDKKIGRSLAIIVFSAIMLLLIGSMALAEDTVYKGVYFNGGTLSLSGAESGSKSVGNSFAFAVERALEINESFELGYGGGLQLSGDIEGDPFNGCKCIPLYLLLNYYPLSVEGVPYLTGQVGYNFMLYDVNEKEGTLRGLYYAVGAGIRIPRYPSIRVEILYTVNNGSGNVKYYFLPNEEKLTASLSRISLAIGLGF